MKIECHCGNITLRSPMPQQLTECNCSICRRYQALWGYFSPADVRINTGAAGASVYCWGDRELEFIRCANCGCVTHYRTIGGDGPPLVAVNFRMAEATVLADVPVRSVNGRDRP